MKKLSRVKFYNHHVLGESEFNFIDSGEEKSESYITLILGQNGSGKSKMLEAVAQSLVYLHRKNLNKKSRWTHDYFFEIDVLKDGEVRTINNLDGTITCSSGEWYDSIDFLPENIIVSAYTFNDKYPMLKEEDFYSYCGIRTVTNNIFVNRPTEDTYDNIVKIIGEEDRLNLMSKVFEELELGNKISIKYKNSRNQNILQKPAVKKTLIDIVENNVVSEEDIDSFINIIKDKTGIEEKGKKKRFQDTGITRFINKRGQVKDVLDYLSKNNLQEKAKTRGFSIDIEFEYNWAKELTPEEIESNEKFVKHVSIFEHLKEIEIVKFGSFKVHRKDFFDFNEASSGEYHLLHLFTSLLSNIEENTLTIIDEPEISLHPNWQNKFIYLLKPILEKYSLSQFIIASHSHFVVSSLESKKSAILTMNRENGTLLINNLEKINTLGWSAEQILFDVFNMVTDRNYYLSKKVQSVINEMAKSSPDDEKIETVKSELREFDRSGLHPEDPFTLILDKILK
jgi:predicted ATPase